MPTVLENNELRWAAGLALLAVALTSLPYLLAPAFLDPGSTFSGFLINPIDGYSYLAKMRQGADLTFEFRLPYSPEPGSGVLLFTYQLILGAISAALGLPQILTYHAARVFGTLAMLGSSYVFFSHALPNGRAKWAAFVLTLFGTGLGWVVLPMEILPIDLWVPEAIPLLSAYANAHFALATAALISAATLIVFTDLLPNARVVLLFIAGLLLALLQPFSAVTIGGVLALWLVIERLRGMQIDRSVVGLSAFGLGALPFLVYAWGVIQQHPVLSAWNAQNLTPTPPLIEVLFGYGLVLVFAVIGMLAANTRGRPAGRMLMTWAVAGFIVLYLPIPLQRRLMLGLFIPLAALAGAGMETIASTRSRFGLLLAATLVISIPSHLVVFGSGLTAVSRGEAGVVVDADDLELYRWIARNLPEQSVVLAGVNSGNRLPAFADVRVLYGHPFETAKADEQLLLIEEYFGWNGDPELGIRDLQNLGVEYVYVSDGERTLGSPTWLVLADLIHREGGSELYKVPES